MQQFCRGAILVLLWLACAARAQTPLISIETTLPSASYTSFSLAADSSSFAPDSAENKALAEKGFGFPVRVRRVMQGYVYAHAASARVLVPVPFGWRGFDDGKRTRLFTPAASIGMVINAMQMDSAQTWDETREQVWKFARQTAAERSKKDQRYSARLIRLADGTFGMRESNIYEAEGDPYSSVTLFRQHPEDARTAIRVNLFAPIGDFDRYLALAGLVMKDMQGAFTPTGLDVDLSKLPK
jgi:hypothetical protein